MLHRSQDARGLACACVIVYLVADVDLSELLQEEEQGRVQVLVALEPRALRRMLGRVEHRHELEHDGGQLAVDKLLGLGVCIWREVRAEHLLRRRGSEAKRG